MNRRDAISFGAAIISSPFSISAAWSLPDARVADLVKSGKIRAGLAVAPIMATKETTTGELRGVAVDLARELAAQIGVELEQVMYARPGAVMAGLKSNAWDLAFLGIDPSRAAEADFTPAYLEGRLDLFGAGEFHHHSRPRSGQAGGSNSRSPQRPSRYPAEPNADAGHVGARRYSGRGLRTGPDWPSRCLRRATA